jgi:hypothetical protein
MSFYKTCPHCGANLDPGESCDCTISQVCTEARAVFPELFTGRTDREIVGEIAGIVRRAEMKEAPADAANTGEGGAEQSLTAVFASIVHKNEEDCQYGT